MEPAWRVPGPPGTWPQAIASARAQRASGEDMGRGRPRQIAVTQPRRIAATSVAARVAREVGTAPVGGAGEDTCINTRRSRSGRSTPAPSCRRTGNPPCRRRPAGTPATVNQRVDVARANRVHAREHLDGCMTLRGRRERPNLSPPGRLHRFLLPGVEGGDADARLLPSPPACPTPRALPPTLNQNMHGWTGCFSSEPRHLRGPRTRRVIPHMHMRSATPRRVTLV